MLMKSAKKTAVAGRSLSNDYNPMKLAKIRCWRKCKLLDIILYNQITNNFTAQELMMTSLLKKAFALAQQLPEWEQDALAAFILEEIAASQQWKQAGQQNGAGTAGEHLQDTFVPDYKPAFSQR